jgi:hypothetical protein
MILVDVGVVTTSVVSSLPHATRTIATAARKPSAPMDFCMRQSPSDEIGDGIASETG